MLNSQLYNQVQVDTDVMSASPQRLIQLLFIRCQTHLDHAKEQMTKGQIGSKWQSLEKAMDIVMYLRLCLNFKDSQCKAMSEELDRLYTYIQHRIAVANIENNPTSVDEVKQLLTTLQSGWDECVKRAEETNDA